MKRKDVARQGPGPAVLAMVCLAASCNPPAAKMPNGASKEFTEVEMKVQVETLPGELDGGTGGVSVDRDGNVYIADFGAILGDHATMGRQVFRIRTDGTSEVFATGFEGASGNEFDSKGNLYQSNIRGHFITRIAPDGTTAVFAREGLKSPVGIAIDPEDTLYVANCGDASIRRITQGGESTEYARSELLRCPNGVTFDETGNLYVANFDNGDVLRIRAGGGEVVRLATVPGENNGHIEYARGALYVVARGAHSIFRVGLDGSVERFAGTGERGRRDGPALEAQLSLPNDLKLAPDGKSFYLNEIAATSGDPDDLSPMVVRRIRLE